MVGASEPQKHLHQRHVDQEDERNHMVPNRGHLVSVGNPRQGQAGIHMN